MLISITAQVATMVGTFIPAAATAGAIRNRRRSDRGRSLSGFLICLRVTTKLPRHEIVIDLTHARVSAAAIDELRERARLSMLSSGIDASETPCRLRIVDPPTFIKTKEHA